MRTSARSAFTIIELAVVIAILGLITGGILGGKTLIRSMNVRKVLTDATTYAIATNQFNDQFNYPPGDLPTATSIWGRADGGTPITNNCTTPYTTPSVGKTTCNGNGDGKIGTGTTAAENHRAWQHLWAAGYITGNFTGVSGPGHAFAHVAPGLNSPGSSIRYAGYSFFSGSTQSGNATYFDGDYDNVIGFGTQTSAGTAMQNALMGKEAYDIDRKADDGLPGTGNIRTYKAVGVTNMSRNCANSGTSTATYLRTTTVPSCSLMFMRDYMTSSKF